MKYIINLNIVFDPNGRVLTLRNNSQLSTGLSKPATRLLSELIHHNNLDLSREDLIKRVWEDYGFSPSNASLNNHISELRKAFDSLGANKDIIITVPRLGFRMEAEIHPVAQGMQDRGESSEQAEENHPIDEPVNIHGVAPLQDPGVPSKYRKSKVLTLTVGLLLAVIATAAVCITMINKDRIPLNATLDRCNIYSPDDSKPPFNFVAAAKKMMVNEGIDCSREDTDVYYTEARPANKLLKVYFMAVCARNGNNTYQDCKNYKLVE